MPDHPQRTIVVLGMHRSGTSALAGSLEEAGVYLGDVSVSNPGNAKGNRESRAVMRLHEALLEANGGSWDDPPETVEWDEPSRAALRSFVSSFADRPVWGCKDPRTLFTLDEWLRQLPHAELVGIVRTPSEVARSLQVRNGMEPDEAYELWRRYNRRLLCAHDRYRFPIVEFTRDPDLFRSRLTALLEILGLESADREPSFYDPELIRPRDDALPPPPEPVSELFRQLRNRALDHRVP